MSVLQSSLFGGVLAVG